MSGWRPVGEVIKRLIEQAQKKQGSNDGSTSQH